MKNTRINSLSFKIGLKKMPLRMRIMLIFSFVCIFQLQATNTYAQSVKLSLSVEESTLPEIFKTIEQKSEYLFNYKDSDVAGYKAKVNIKSGIIDEILSQVLKNTDLIYSVNNRHITISKSVKETNQSLKITGTITDEQGEPLIGVAISVKGHNTGTMTDVNGNFALDIPARGTVLEISYIGYVKQEISVSNTTNLVIKLKEAYQDLDEVIVVGYGTQKKVNLTGSIGIVSTKDLTIKPVGQTSAALQGLLPGVTIIQNSGQPGNDGGTIRIRGVGTLNDSNPMILIDGVEGSMNNIDPNTIESISVLKDAASASIYGSRAANGVILVTTKRGTASQFKVSYNNYFGWQKATDMPQMVDAIGYMELLNTAYKNEDRDPLYSTDLIDAYRQQNGVSSDEYPNTDWQKETLTGSGFQQNHFFNISGGSDKLKMFTSLGYFNQDGLIKRTGFERISLRNNMDWNLTSKLSVRLDLQFIKTQTTTPYTSPVEIFQWMNGIPANQIGINSNGTWGVGWNGTNPISHTYDSGSRAATSPWGSVNATVIYKPTEWITAEVNAAPKYVVRDEHNLRKAIQTYLPDGTPSYKNPAKSELTDSHYTDIYNNYRATITAEKNIENHDIKGMVGYSQESYKTSGFTAYRDSVNVNFPVLNTGGSVNKNNEGTASEWALRSFFGRLNYNFKQKYLFEFNLRYDGSSRFAKGNKYSLFPSVSGGWRISEEDFMQQTKNVIDDAKIRASWGQLGNQNIGTYPFTSQIVYGTGAMDGSVNNTSALNSMPNALIKWETTEAFGVGIDLTMLSNKLTITADYYSRKTKDILLQLDIPYIIGLNAPFQNAGIVDNKGWELGIGYRNSTGDFNYNVNFNISDVKNKIVDLKGQDGTNYIANRTGYAVNSLYGYVAEGYFQNEDEIKNHATQFGTVKPGDIKYKDFNEDGVINGEDKRVIGSTVPRYTFGLNLGAEYKGFDLSALFQGVGKADGYIYGAGIWAFAVTGAVGGTAREDNKDYWTEDNRNARFPRLTFSQTNNTQHSSFWKRDAKYLRLKNFQIGYTLPKQVTRKANIDRLRIFANGTNLFSLDNFLSGYNVEMPVGDGFYYPQVRVLSFGLELNF